MKQYMLTVHDVEGTPAPAPEVMQKMYQDVEALNAELQSAGVWVFGGGLHPPSSATDVYAATVYPASSVPVNVADGPLDPAAALKRST